MITTSKTPNQARTYTHTPPAQEPFQSRPFAAMPLQPEHEAPDVATQLENAQRLGHTFENIHVLPPDPPIIQARLTVRAAGDKYEQEADRIAAQVVERLHSPAANPSDMPAGTSPDLCQYTRTPGEPANLVTQLRECASVPSAHSTSIAPEHPQCHAGLRLRPGHDR